VQNLKGFGTKAVWFSENEGARNKGL